MTTVKYLCEFFFGNFWHFWGLVIVLAEVVALLAALLPWNSIKKTDKT